MLDAHGVWAATPLWALRYRLLDLVFNRQVNFSGGCLHCFIDKKGLLAETADLKFISFYEDAVEGFIRYASDMFDPEFIREAIINAEAQFFSLRLNAMEETKRGRATHKILITRENLAHVMILLQKPTASMVQIEADKGNQPELVSAFELVGDFILPDTGRAKYINDLVKDLEAPKLEAHWAAMLNEVFEVVRGMLDE